MTLDKIFYSLRFKQELVAAVTVNSKFFSLTAFLNEAFIINIRIILCNNYIFIICIVDNNAVINNYGKPPRLYFALHGHVKGSLRNLQTISARVLKKLRQPCFRTFLQKINFTDYSASTCFHELTQTAVTRINVL